MSDMDLELKLLAGMPINIEGVGKIFSPTVREIIEIGESNYNQYLSALLFDKNSIETDIKEELSNFEMMFAYAYHHEEFRKILFESISFFFKDEVHLDHDDQDVFFLFKNGKMGKSVFENVQDIIKTANWVSDSSEESEQYNPADEETAKVIREMLERRKKKAKPKPVVNLYSIISAIAWKSPDMNISKILDLTIFQLYDGFRRLEKIDSIHYTLNGIYSGNVDAKKINMSDLNWAKIIET
ncbi:hypothetical protein BC351_10555 [Paenibacillus ferrarius]|uniref:Uncharacterized protein n=1 Tax=Paenibacillus ferrarius TaxID=1469647 RepID=A0A1V4H8Z1_9BACL|nr:hypothetical protein [Paenibacillus ferrarius]OPH47621.1 hypothetical protein BC351_10555 [Paenibacillus ferrarius]